MERVPVRSSVVVVFELVADGYDHHLRRRLDLEERDVARPSEGDDQFAQERALAGLAAREGRGLEGCESRLEGGQGLLCQREVPVGAVRLAFEHEVEQTIEVGFGLAILPEPSVREAGRAGFLSVVPLAEAYWIRTVGVIYRSDRQLSLAAKKFVSLLTE